MESVRPTSHSREGANMKHRIVTAAQMKEIERAGDAHGLPYLQMMENAGLAASGQLKCSSRIVSTTFILNSPLYFFCGIPFGI